MKRPIELDYVSQVAYTLALEAYYDELVQPEQELESSLADVIRAEPTELIHKWRVLEIVNYYATQYVATSRPQRKPLTRWTEAQHERAYRNSPELHKDVKSLAAFKRVAKAISAMYGIKENT